MKFILCIIELHILIASPWLCNFFCRYDSSNSSDSEEEPVYVVAMDTRGGQ